jgi:hypothetical protein
MEPRLNSVAGSILDRDTVAFKLTLSMGFVLANQLMNCRPGCCELE